MNPWDRFKQQPDTRPVVTPDPSSASAIVAATPPVSPPNPAGLTPSAPVNFALGGGVTGAINTGVTTAAQDPLLVLFGIGLAFFFNWFKQWKHFKQQQHAHIALLVFGVLIGVIVLGVIGHEEMSRAIAKGCGIAANAWADYTGIKIGGLPGMPAASNEGGGYL